VLPGATPPGDLHGQDLIAHYAILQLPVLGELIKRLHARWVCPDTLGDPRAFPSGDTGVKACRFYNWMGVTPCEGARPGWLAHTETPLPGNLHAVRMRLGWAVGSWLPTPNSPTAPRVTVGCVRWMTRYLHVVVEWPAYDSLRAKYGSDLGFQGHSMRTIMPEAPQLALASFLSVICEMRT
jgi:hypothetical protein